NRKTKPEKKQTEPGAREPKKPSGSNARSEANELKEANEPKGPIAVNGKLEMHRIQKLTHLQRRPQPLFPILTSTMSLPTKAFWKSCPTDTDSCARPTIIISPHRMIFTFRNRKLSYSA